MRAQNFKGETVRYRLIRDSDGSALVLIEEHRTRVFDRYSSLPYYLTLLDDVRHHFGMVAQLIEPQVKHQSHIDRLWKIELELVVAWESLEKQLDNLFQKGSN